jgi:glycolate oxidase
VQLALAAGVPTDRVTDDLVERRLYSRDLAPVPALLTRPFFRTLPDAVVRPAGTEQVAEVMRHASRERIPVTPRAAASTSYYNAVPVRGGLVLDVNDLRGVLDLDASRQTVHVLPATTWWELDDALRVRGYAVRSYPSSAVSATVGGWVSTQGHGIGSLAYGALGGQLVSLLVVLPNGETRTIRSDTEPPLDWFVAAEGTLGVLTEVELAVRSLPAVESHRLFAFDDLNALGAGVRSLARSEPRPYTVLFADSGYLGLLARAGFPTLLDRSTDPTGAGGPAGPSILLVSFQGEQAEVGRGEDALARLPGRELPNDLALEEWNQRLYHLRAKRAGPSLLAAEQWLPLAGLTSYLVAVKNMASRHRLLIGSYGLAVTPELALVMTIYPADERRTVEYLAAIGFTKRLYDLGASCGGRPYGVGLWNTAYLSRLFSRDHLAELRRRKTLLDPNGIMNPGKLYGAPFPLWPAVFRPGAELLATAYVGLRGGR